MFQRLMRNLSLVVAIAAFGAVASASPVILPATPAGDCSYSWNSKTSAYNSYAVGGQSLGVSLYFGGQYGNDFTISIIEIPISQLAGKTLAAATIEVNSLGFGDNYYNGAAYAYFGWLDTGSQTLTGNPVADAVTSGSGSIRWEIYNSYAAANSFSDGAPGVKSFDITSCLQNDLLAGRSYSTFIMNCSRDVWGEIAAAESGNGARIVANVVPEPGSIALCSLGALTLLARRRKA